MKKKSNIRKGTASQKPNNPNPLDSANWISESSVGQAPARTAAAPPNPSYSNDPCEDCHVDFKENEVSVKWSKGAGNPYKAASNLKTGSGGWKPDVWKILSASPKAKIHDKTGVVTFGNDGETITIQAGVKRCPDCTNTFVLNIIRLQIFDGQDDVTGKNTNRLVGEKIDLYAIVTPAELMPDDGACNWTIPKTVLKDYLPDKNSDPVLPLPDEEKKDVHLFFHWVDGGTKTVSLGVRINGLTLNAKTTYKVTRPIAATQVGKSVQPLIRYYDDDVPPAPQKWRLVAALEFKRTSGAPSRGKTAWLQTISFVSVIAKDDNGNTIFDQLDPGPWPALDNRFPYLGDINIDTGDAPGYTEKLNISLVAHFEGIYSMYLMYLSNRAESRWVALRVMHWSVVMTAKRIGPQLAPRANYKVVMPGSKLKPPKNDQDAPDAPDWKRTLKTE